jgi:squalene-hopene/tetraprenyl-beta-curcumene cyclase
MRRSAITLALGSGLLLITAVWTWVFEITRPSSRRTESYWSSVPRLRDWDEGAAARYLDQREIWWMSWSAASRDRGTFCVSCHTTLPYMLARPNLDVALGETEPSPIELKILENVRKRVRLWQNLEPYYSDKEDGAQKSEESRATEAVLNALLLSSEDSRHGVLTEETSRAFANLWALQLTKGDDKGAWAWQKFGLQPWESRDSTYFGASLAALAVGLAPEEYAAKPEIQSNLQQLRDYLNRKLTEQSLLNQLGALWASSVLRGLLRSTDQSSIIQNILNKQQEDGGWRLSSLLWSWRNGGLSSLLLTWRKEDWNLQESDSDGLATGMICYVLLRAGVPRDNRSLSKGFAWLERAQNKTEGLWTGYSLNKRRNPTSDVGRFMSDAASGFAVLALSERNTSSPEPNRKVGQ